jgi:TM2 domain-containing membrane protein YozV
MIPQKIRIVAWIIVVAVFFLLPCDVCAQSENLEDVVYLKDSKVIRGRILEQKIGESLKIESNDGSVFIFSMDEIERIAKEPVREKFETTVKPKPTGYRRDPFLAGALSFFIPGAGQVYNGEYGKGALQFGMFYAGAIIAISNMDWDFIWGETDDFEGNSGLLFLGSALALGSMIWSIADAPKSANRINEENGWVILPGVSDNLYLTMTDLRVDGRLTPGVKIMLKL